MNATLESQNVMNSLIGWVGGKKALAKTLVALLPQRHTCYVEVFGGAGWVLFGKERSKVEVYNDLDGRLVNLFRCVKYHADGLCRELELLVPSREMFDGFRTQEGLTDIQRAARFYYVVKASFGRKGEHFGTSKTWPLSAGVVPAKMRADMERVQARLGRVQVECRDCVRVVEQYDGPDTVLFCDPPYLGSEDVYQAAFGQDDHGRLHAALEAAQGRWLLTYGDHEWVRAAYAAFYIYAVEAAFTINKTMPRPGRQLIVTNYRLTRRQMEQAPKPLTRIGRRRSRKAALKGD